LSIGSFSSASARLFSKGRPKPANDSDQQIKLVAPDLRELARRTVPRDLVDHLTTITLTADETLDARLMDISPYGFQARARGPILTRGERVSVQLPLVGTHEGHVMWGLKGYFGCKFIAPIEPDIYLTMLGTIRATGLLPDDPPLA
jgi:hypothetical protein